MTTPPFENQAIFPGAECFLIKQFMDAEGIRPSQWLLGTGLTEDALTQPNVMVSLLQFDIIYRNVFRLVRSPDRGLRFGRALNLSRWGMLALALCSARTLGSALNTANQFRTLLRSRFELVPEERGKELRVEIRPDNTLTFPVTPEFAHEVFLASLRSQISNLLGEPFAFSRVELSYPAPEHHRAYQASIGCEVQFDRAGSAYWIPMHVINRRLPLANPITEKQTLGLCENELYRVRQMQEGDVCWLVKNELNREPRTLPGLESVAANLSLAPRTLRRRLQEAGTNFRELYQQCQVQRALRALSALQMTQSQIAAYCGFRDTASFREAFKRWTQMTPRDYQLQFKDSQLQFKDSQVQFKDSQNQFKDTQNQFRGAQSIQEGHPAKPV